MKVGRLVMSVCQTNCYFIYHDTDEAEKEVIFIDPGDKGKQICDALKQKGFRVGAILLTHGHFDHIWGANALREASGAKIYAFEGEKDICENADNNVSEAAGRAETVQADYYEKDGAVLEICGFKIRLIATPGHTHGSCCYYLEDEKVLFSGDTLFEASVGRTDLPTGSMSTLVRSIKEKLFVLPEDVIVYPGHGSETCIADEKRYNPFVQ